MDPAAGSWRTTNPAGRPLGAATGRWCTSHRRRRRTSARPRRAGPRAAAPPRHRARSEVRVPRLVFMEVLDAHEPCPARAAGAGSRAAPRAKMRAWVWRSSASSWSRARRGERVRERAGSARPPSSAPPGGRSASTAAEDGRVTLTIKGPSDDGDPRGPRRVRVRGARRRRRRPVYLVVRAGHDRRPATASRSPAAPGRSTSSTAGSPRSWWPRSSSTTPTPTWCCPRGWDARSPTIRPTPTAR